MCVCVCTGKVVHSMVAHLDAVTCLTTDPKGTYLISGSEYDLTVSLWNQKRFFFSIFCIIVWCSGGTPVCHAKNMYFHILKIYIEYKI